MSVSIANFVPLNDKVLRGGLLFLSDQSTNQTYMREAWHSKGKKCLRRRKTAKYSHLKLIKIKNLCVWEKFIAYLCFFFILFVEGAWSGNAASTPTLDERNSIPKKAVNSKIYSTSASIPLKKRGSSDSSTQSHSSDEELPNSQVLGEVQNAQPEEQNASPGVPPVKHLGNVPPHHITPNNTSSVSTADNSSDLFYQTFLRSFGRMRGR